MNGISRINGIKSIYEITSINGISINGISSINGLSSILPALTECFSPFLQMQNLTNIVLFPVETVLKNELRGSKGDLKRPFDRAWRDYHDKYSELERAKKKQAKEAGMIRSELTAGEIAEDLEKERKYLQIATADYLIKANEIKTKKGTELLQHLLDYYRAQTRYRHTHRS